MKFYEQQLLDAIYEHYKANLLYLYASGQEHTLNLLSAHGVDLQSWTEANDRLRRAHEGRGLAMEIYHFCQNAKPQGLSDEELMVAIALMDFAPDTNKLPTGAA